MSEPSAARAAFAPVWPRIYKAPAGKELIPPYGRVRVFNRDLTVRELGPLTETFPVPGRTLRRIGGYMLFGACLTNLALLLVALLADFLFSGIEVTESAEHTIVAIINYAFSGAASLSAWVIPASIVIGAAGIAVDFVAWKKWGTSLAVAWDLYEGRLVRTTGLPAPRKQKSDGHCRRLDAALQKLDSNSAGACLLASAARDAIGRFIDLPVISEESRRVSDDTSAQKLRKNYEATAAAENAALLEAEDAVLAVEGLVDEAETGTS